MKYYIAAHLTVAISEVAGGLAETKHYLIDQVAVQHWKFQDDGEAERLFVKLRKAMSKRVNYLPVDSGIQDFLARYHPTERCMHHDEVFTYHTSSYSPTSNRDLLMIAAPSLAALHNTVTNDFSIQRKLTRYGGIPEPLAFGQYWRDVTNIIKEQS